MSNLDKALALAQAFYVFPCRDKDEWVGQKLYEAKAPYTYRGFHEATRNRDQITKWWTDHPDALVGVACGMSGLVVLDIDIDSEKGTDGWYELTEAGIEPEPTYNYETRRGGMHYVYAANKDEDLSPKKNYVLPSGEVLEGIDRRSGGSYIIWWGPVPTVENGRFEAVPAWFAHDTPTVSGNIYEGSAEEWVEALQPGAADALVKIALGKIPAGDFGHTEMITQQTSLVKLGTENHPGVADALEKLRAAWLRHPYDTPEHEQDWNVSLAGAIAKFGGRTEEERDFWKARPILQHIYGSSRNLMASPWALLGGALLRTTHTLPYHVHYRSAFGGSSLNSIAVFVGDSGGGKTLLQNQLNELFDFAGKEFVAHEVGSGEAISEQFVLEVEKGTGNILGWSNMDHAEMFSFDEVGRLNAMAGRSGGTTVLEYLKSGWSGSRLGRRLVGGRGVEVPAHEYRMTAFLNAQPERADVLLSEDEIEGGFPGRVMWVGLMDPTAAREYDPKPITQYKVPRPDWSKVTEIPALPQMNEAHVADRRKFHTGVRDKLDGHELMLKVRIAVGLMAMDGRTTLNDEDWDLAEVVLNHSRTTRKMVQSRLAQKAIKEVEASGKAMGRRQAISEEASSEFLEKRVKDQIESAKTKLKSQGKNITKGVVKAHITKSLHPTFEDVWAEMYPNE